MPLNYYDYFCLSLQDGSVDFQEIADLITRKNPQLELSDFEFVMMPYEVNQPRNVSCIQGHNIPWNNHDKDMVDISLLYPDIVFKLHGESSDDKWEAYYKNGSYQFCFAQTIYPPYDLEKLEIYPDEEALYSEGFDYIYDYDCEID